MVVLSPGEGKSALGCCVACELSRKTLVVAPDTKLIQQWKGAIKKWAPLASVGIVCGSWNEKKHAAPAKCDFVLTTDETASRCELPTSFLRSFGTAIIDEAHHVASKSLSQILPRLPCRHILGLSATPDRADGLEHSLYWLMGPCAARYLRIPEVTLLTDTLDVCIADYPDSKRSIVRDRRSGDLVWFKCWENVSTDWKRNQFITTAIKDLVRKRERRKVVLLVRFRKHVGDLREALAEHFSDEEVFVLMGGMATDETLAAARAPKVRVLLGTMSFLDEGFDDPVLDTIVMGMPRSASGGALRQSIGRIERFLAGKKKPLVVDVVDFGVPEFESMARGRAKTYRQHGWFISRWKKSE